MNQTGEMNMTSYDELCGGCGGTGGRWIRPAGQADLVWESPCSDCNGTGKRN